MQLALVNPRLHLLSNTSNHCPLRQLDTEHVNHAAPISTAFLIVTVLGQNSTLVFKLVILSKPLLARERKLVFTSVELQPAPLAVSISQLKTDWCKAYLTNTAPLFIKRTVTVMCFEISRRALKYPFVFPPIPEGYGFPNVSEVL